MPSRESRTHVLKFLARTLSDQARSAKLTIPLDFSVTNGLDFLPCLLLLNQMIKSTCNILA